MSDLVQRTPMQEVCETIAGPVAERIKQALPTNITLDRFVRVTLTAVQQNPDLIVCDRQSLYNSVIRCAQDGLLPDGREAALVEFKVKGEKRVQYLPMVGGLRKVAAKHGITLNAFVVHEHDEFDYTLGEAPHVHHKPPKLNEPRGNPIGAYAVATFHDGAMVCPPEVMSRDEIEKVRGVSRAATSEYGPWVKWWDQMARKTVARRLFKQLPLGDIDERSAAVLDAADADVDLPVIEPKLSREEANLSASIVTEIPRDDDGPDDTPEVVDDADVTVVDEGGSNASLFVQPTKPRGQQ